MFSLRCVPTWDSLDQPKGRKITCKDCMTRFNQLYIVTARMHACTDI